MSGAAGLRDALHGHAPWLFDPALDTCVVGSMALAEACRRAGVPGPEAADLDLAWALSPEAGSELLAHQGVAAPVSPQSRARGTLAFHLLGRRIEVTTFRVPEGPPAGEARIRADLARRDMTIGAIAWWLREDRILDPFGGVADWLGRRIAAVGDPADRVREHPIRWLRYRRKAAVLGFDLAPAVRRTPFDREAFRAVPAEAIAAEIRAALLGAASPGRFLLELHEARALRKLAPELAPQFDGRPAGPVRHHPEVSQALHLILALEWAAERGRALPADDRAQLMVAVLCHDLGKNLTPRRELPAHHGHERAGLPLLRTLLDRLPGLTDARGRRLAEQVCALHLTARCFRELRPGTLARLYEEHFREPGFRADLFALAVGADSGGRLDRAAEGDRVAAAVREDLDWLCTRCRSVDARALRATFPDVERFREALHAERTRALARAADRGSTRSGQDRDAL